MLIRETKAVPFIWTKPVSWYQGKLSLKGSTTAQGLLAAWYEAQAPWPARQHVHGATLLPSFPAMDRVSLW